MLLLVAATAAALALWLGARLGAIIAEFDARLRALERERTSWLPQPVVAPRPATPPTLSTSTVPLPQPVRVTPRVVLSEPPPAIVETAVRAAPTSNAMPSAETLETRIGSRWLLYVGVVAIVVGVSYFEKLAIDNHWIGEAARVVQGGVLGLLLVAVGMRFVRMGYRLYGQIVSGSGIAILYVSTYAAFNFYHLISHPMAFGLMSVITMLAAWLADRQRSQGLALVAVGGGFATPFLLPATTDAEVALFGYDTILIGGTMLLSHRRDWPTLNVVSYAFTALTFLAWAADFYTSSKYLTTEVFLTVFCGMFLYILWKISRSEHPAAGVERAILWTAPCGYYVVSLVILSEHSLALLVYLVLLALVGVVVGSRTASWVRFAFCVAVANPLLVWSGLHGVRAWLVPGVVAWTGVYVLNLAGLFEATVGRERRFTTADIAHLHVSGLSSFVGAYLLIDPLYSGACAPLAAAFALAHAAFGALFVKRFRDEALQLAALAFTFLTIAIALQFEGAWMTGGWAAEGAVVTWLGLRERRAWLRAGGLMLFAVAIVRLGVLLFSAPSAGQLVLMNRRGLCGLFVIGLTYALTVAHQRYSTTDRRQAEIGAGLLLAQLLLLALAASETVAYWTLHTSPPFQPDAGVIDASLIVGSVIMWLGLRRKQEWLRASGGAIVALAAFWVLSIQLQAAPLRYVPIANGRVAAGLLTVVCLYVLTLLHRRAGQHLEGLATHVAILTTGASLLTLSLLTSEIDAFWAARGAAGWSIAREGLQAIAWAGVGSFLIWHGLSNRHAWIRAIGAALLGAAVVRLLRVQFVEMTSSYVVVANARLMSSIVIIALLYGLASLYRNTSNAEEGRDLPSTVLWLLANALTLTLLTSEITAYWHLQDRHHVSTFLSANSHFAREMTLSITWAGYATLLVVVGLSRKYAPIRYFAMTVFAVTIVKVFAIDLAELDRLYRVLSVMGLGVMLLMTSYLYQRAAPKPVDND